MKNLVQIARFPTGLALRKKEHNLMQGQMNGALASAACQKFINDMFSYTNVILYI